MSIATVNDVFSTGLVVSDEYAHDDKSGFAPLIGTAPIDHFSTATWCLPSGRTARSVASAAHCESESNISRIRRLILNLSGRKLEQSETA